jgi:hypothetical protein
MNEYNPQAFGELKARVEFLIEQDRLQSQRLDAIVRQLDSVNEKLSQAKGGWKMLMLLGGGSAGIGAWLVHFLQSTPKG